jgi:hypothetical protein
MKESSILTLPLDTQSIWEELDFNLKFGSSDLLFCHHSDIHLTSDDAEVIRFFRDRWKKAGVLNSA